MSDSTQQQLGNTLWAIADKLRGAMNADDFRYEVLIFLISRGPSIKGYVHVDVVP
jgi:type I restriction enzyme M protein